MALEPVRVFLVDFEPMTREAIENLIRRSPQLTMVEPIPAEPIREAIARSRAEVVVIGRDDPSLAASVLEVHPKTRMLAVVGDGLRGRLYELKPSRRELGAFSAETFLSVLADVRQPRSNWMV